MPSSPGRLLAAGMPAAQAAQIGSSDAINLTATGSTKAGALPLVGGLNIFTTAALNTGGMLPPASASPWVNVYNGGSNPILVYTGTSTDVINALSAGASFSVTNGKCATFIPAGNRWIANLSN